MLTVLCTCPFDLPDPTPVDTKDDEEEAAAPPPPPRTSRSLPPPGAFRLPGLAPAAPLPLPIAESPVEVEEVEDDVMSEDHDVALASTVSGESREEEVAVEEQGSGGEEMVEEEDDAEDSDDAPPPLPHSRPSTLLQPVDSSASSSSHIAHDRIELVAEPEAMDGSIENEEEDEDDAPPPPPPRRSQPTLPHVAAQ